LYLNANTAFGARATFDLQSGVISETTAGTAKIETLQNGWYRCSVSGTAATTRTTVWFGQLNNAGVATDTVYTGDGTSGLFFWGAQVEAGAYQTTYIPTTTAAVTRLADSCFLTGASSFIGQTEGSIVAEVDLQIPAENGAIVQLDSGDSTNRIIIGAGPTVNVGCINAGVGYTLPVTGNWVVGVNKIAISYSASNITAYLNGVSIGSATPTAGTFPTTQLTQINLGSRITGGARGAYLGSTLSKSALYTTRLSNTELQALTTL
jgi:hypothetical protein